MLALLLPPSTVPASPPLDPAPATAPLVFGLRPPPMRFRMSPSSLSPVASTRRVVDDRFWRKVGLRPKPKLLSAGRLVVRLTLALGVAVEVAAAASRKDMMSALAAPSNHVPPIHGHFRWRTVMLLRVDHPDSQSEHVDGWMVLNWSATRHRVAERKNAK